MASIDITTIVEGIFTLIAALITAVIIPYIKSKTSSQQQSDIASWIGIAVAAAEQIYNGPGRGDEKKAYVLEWLRSRGIDVDSDVIDAMVESAVYSLKKELDGNA